MTVRPAPQGGPDENKSKNPTAAPGGPRVRRCSSASDEGETSDDSQVTTSTSDEEELSMPPGGLFACNAPFSCDVYTSVGGFPVGFWEETAECMEGLLESDSFN